MFGTDDVIYVPENCQLVFDDVYRWKRFRIDVRRLGLRVRTETYDDLSQRIRGALELCRKSPRFTDSIAQISENSDLMIRDLAAVSGGLQNNIRGNLHDFFRSEQAAWWVRVSDLPSESFFHEDYERAVATENPYTPYLTYGHAHIAQLDALDVELPGGNEEEMPFAVDVPAEGLKRFTIPTHEPLPLVREFCGAHGASAYGHTVNLDTWANIAENHHFCTPIGTLGERLYATMYFYYGTPKAADVVGKVPEDGLQEYMLLLESSKFEVVHKGPTWRIFEREGDVVHLYSGLAGKETEGAETMPSFMLVASAGGQFDPQHRADLFEAINETVRK